MTILDIARYVKIVDKKQVRRTNRESKRNLSRKYRLTVNNNEIDEGILKNGVRQHIKLFPVMSPNYTRKKSIKMYLEDCLMH